uniref:Uncharacterized protein n=1 Tax=Arundo donax TaxID=35708 RepID=A0A0A9EJW4_ARUDO
MHVGLLLKVWTRQNSGVFGARTFQEPVARDNLFKIVQESCIP